jgi:hypothetical protein
MQIAIYNIEELGLCPFANAFHFVEIVSFHGIKNERFAFKK